MRLHFVVALVVLAVIGGLLYLSPGLTSTVDQNILPEDDGIRIAEAFSLAAAIQDTIWPDWHTAPFAVLLVTPDVEYLVGHPYPSDDFQLAGYDARVGADVYTRPRVFDPTFLATFPAVSGVPTIVVGRPETTGLNSSSWIITLMHEHFHQFQMSRPDYYTSVDELNLSGGDTTGMWMLNYPFPYEDADLNTLIDELTDQLITALNARDSDRFDEEVAGYLEIRAELISRLESDDYGYLSLQLWQEGLARYTEYRVANAAAENYQPSRAFRQLQDYVGLRELADREFEDLLAELEDLTLDGYQRVSFYSIGAAEGLLLDEVNPDWQDRYFTDKFYLEAYFE